MGRVLASGEEFGGGRYVIDGPIGAGSMGVVYRVQDTSLGTSRALKVIGSETGRPEPNRRFEREWMAMVRMSEHPHVVSIVDRGERLDGSPYLVMEFINGAPLDEVMAGHCGDLAWTVQALRGVARALDHAHMLGLVHRDVKPSNIMVGPGDHLYLMDFGIAHLPDASKLTQTFMPRTERYCSPEQLLNHDVSSPSDQFSLAIVAFELVVGRPPFFDPEERLDGLPRSWTAELPGPTERLWNAFERALRPKPASRWPSCESFIDALAAAHGEAAAARPNLVGNAGPAPTLVRPAVVKAMPRAARRPASAVIMKGGRDVLVAGETPAQLSWLLGPRRARAVCDRLRPGLSIGYPFSVGHSGDAVTNVGEVVTRLSRSQWWPGVITEDGDPGFDLPPPTVTTAAPDGFRGTIDEIAHHHWGVEASLVPPGARFAEDRWDFTGFRQAPCPRCERPLADLNLPKDKMQHWHCYFCPSCQEGFAPKELAEGNRYWPARYPIRS